MIFKVWSNCRRKKKTVIIEEGSKNKLEVLMEMGAKKLGIVGVSLVLASDGTEIDADDVLMHFQQEVFILLAPGEVWLSDKDLDAFLPSTNFNENCMISSTPIQVFDVMSAIPVNKHSIPHGSVIEKISSQPATEVEQVIAPVDDNTENDTSLANRASIWSNYEIPYNKLGSGTLKSLNEKKRNERTRTLKDCCGVIVGEMRILEKHIPESAFRNVAAKLLDKFPEVVEDQDNYGKRVGTGYSSILTMMINRNNYLNRPHQNDSVTHKLKVKCGEQRKFLSARSGCPNWAPSENDMGTMELMESHKQYLQTCDMLDLTNSETLKDLVEKFDQTFFLQRNFMNGMKPINIDRIQKEWPCLLRIPFIYRHFDKLTDSSVNAAETKFSTERNKIITYGIAKKFVETSVTDIEDLKDLLLIQTIFKHFNEKIDDLLPSVKITTENQELEMKLEHHFIYITDYAVPNDNDNYPDEEGQANCKREYWLFLKSKCVAKLDSVKEAFFMLFSSYFVFMDTYPLQCACSLVFCQMFFFNIHTVGASKARRKEKVKKAETFIRRLNNIIAEDLIDVEA